MRDWLCPVPLLTNSAFNSLVCRCLHLACSEGNLKMVNLLFDYKATLDVYEDCGVGGGDDAEDPVVIRPGPAMDLLAADSCDHERVPKGGPVGCGHAADESPEPW